MQNFIKTIINAVQSWTKKEIKNSVADWNQNDSSADNYVKNRPFWKDDDSDIYLVDSQGLKFSLADSNVWPYRMSDNTLYAHVVEGFSYKNYDVFSWDNGCGFNTDWTVIWDGVEYKCSTYNYECLIIGNANIACGQGENFTEPFAIIIDVYGEQSNSKSMYIVTTDSSVTHTVKLFYFQEGKTHIISTDWLPPLVGRISNEERAAEIFNDYNNNIASNWYSHAEGGGTTASGTSSHAEGSSTKASGSYSHAEGYGTDASGSSSHAEGSSTKASSSYSHAEGYNTTASGTSSHAEGSSTKASGSYSHAEGYGTKATTTNDTVSRTSATSKGYYTHAEGYGTVAYGPCSHAEGNGTKASGNYSHAEGDSTTASGTSSHAEGQSNTASGSYSHAEGYGTAAPGLSSHAEGNDTMASGPYSHSEGLGTTAQRKSQHTQGEYNMIDTGGFARGKYAHIVGNGTSPTARSNAHTLDWNGLGWFAGGLKVGGTGQDDEAAVEVALKTDIPSTIVQSVNGVTPDANGNVVLEVGGETVTDEHINELIDAKLGVVSALVDEINGEVI